MLYPLMLLVLQYFQLTLELCKYLKQIRILPPPPFLMSLHPLTSVNSPFGFFKFLQDVKYILYIFQKTSKMLFIERFMINPI